jgi:Tfp pilus assembly protein PilO
MTYNVQVEIEAVIVVSVEIELPNDASITDAIQRVKQQIRDEGHQIKRVEGESAKRIPFKKKEPISI